MVDSLDSIGTIGKNIGVAAPISTALTKKEAGASEAIESARQRLKNQIAGSRLSLEEKLRLNNEVESELNGAVSASTNVAQLIGALVARIKSEIIEESREESVDEAVASLLTQKAAYDNMMLTQKEYRRAHARSHIRDDINGYIQSFMDENASLDTKRVVGGTIQSVLQSPEVVVAKNELGKYDPKLVLAVQLGKEKFFNYIDEMVEADPKGTYSATLREISGFEVYSESTIALMEEISEGKISGQEAYDRWQKIKDVEYDALEYNTRASLNKNLKKFPDLLKQFNAMDFEKEVEPLILQMKENPDLLQKVIKNVDMLTGSEKDWKDFTPEEQKLIIAYFSKNTIHAASDTICTENVCHAVHKKEVSVEKAVEKPAEKTAEPEKSAADEWFEMVKQRQEKALEAHLGEFSNVQTKSGKNKGSNPFDLDGDKLVTLNEVIQSLQKAHIDLDNYEENGVLTDAQIKKAMETAATTLEKMAYSPVFSGEQPSGAQQTQQVKIQSATVGHSQG